MSTGTVINSNTTYILNLNDLTFGIKDENDIKVIDLKNNEEFLFGNNLENNMFNHIDNLKQSFPNSDSKINITRIISSQNLTLNKVSLLKDEKNNYIDLNKQYIYFFSFKTGRTNSRIYFVYFSKNFNFPNFKVIGGSPNKINYIVKEINNNDLYNVEIDGVYGPVLTYSNDINFINKYNSEKNKVNTDNTTNNTTNNTNKYIIIPVSILIIILLIYSIYKLSINNKN
jgi:hypothetical protein